VCHACAARFYDLWREPVACPSCGAHYVPDGPPIAAEAIGRASRVTNKTGWRGRTFKHPAPDVAPDVASAEEGSEAPFVPASNHDVVLEEDPDEADVSGLIGHHGADPKEH
jgi:hypothetical protein